MTDGIGRRSVLAAALYLGVGGRAAAAEPASLERFGATGNGATDDSAAINRALAWSAANHVGVVGRAGARYRLCPTGRKRFLSPSGTAFASDFALEIGDGAAVDFAGAALCPEGETIALCNRSSLSGADRIRVAGARFEAARSRGTVALFVGCQESRFVGLSVHNATSVGLAFAALRGCVIDALDAADITGVAIMLGGNTAWQLSGCQIGSLSARNIRSLGTFNQPGNPFLVGAREVRIAALTAANCAGGIKFTANCHDIRCDAVDFDGAVVGDEDLGTSNSGLKVQGDATGRAAAIRFNTVRVSNAYGAGIFIRQASGVSIKSYVGVANGRGGKDADIDVDTADDVHIGSGVIRAAGSSAIVLGKVAGRVAIDTLEIDRSGGVTRRAEAIVLQSGELDVGDATILTRTPGLMAPSLIKAVGTADASGLFESLRVNGQAAGRFRAHASTNVR